VTIGIARAMLEGGGVWSRWGRVMSGLLALLDDVAALAKLAAVQVDDVGAMAAKAGAKSLGVVIDDTAVTPKYVTGLPAARELPIVWQIARGSLFNKLVLLLPGLLLLNIFAPWVITPLLMLGGAYLCFEGAEKVWHVFHPHDPHTGDVDEGPQDAAHLERTRVAAAIKTDFILSAEIMTIALSTIESDSRVTEAIVLAVVAVLITAAVYGLVAVLVKADDVGLKMAVDGRLATTRATGRGIVKGMPGLMTGISTVGTAAMLWVGGSIVIHGMEVLGWDWLGHAIHDVAHAAAVAVPGIGGFLEWLVKAVLDGIFGLALGLLLIPVATKVIAPLAAMIPARKAS
jgi:predicted DNA repair protein MutK